MLTKTTKRYLLCGCAIFVLVIAGSLAIYGRYAGAAALTNAAVAPNTSGTDNLIGQTNAQWKFTMTNATELAPGSAVQVILPNISNAPPFTFGTPAIVSTSSVAAIGFSYTVAANSGTRTLGLTTVTAIPAGTTFSITVNGINNPLGSQTNLTNLTWTFRTGTIGAGGPAGADITIVDGPATATRSLIRGGQSIFSAADSAITASNYAVSAANVTYTFSFVATTSIPIGGKINIHFPADFTVDNATTSSTLQADINGSSANAPQIAATGAVATSTSNGRNDVIFTTSGAATGGVNTVTVAVGGITNPSTANAYRPIYIYTTNANGGLLDGSPFADSANDVYNGPPPVDSIHIGGTNDMIISVYKQSGADLIKLSAAEIAQVRVGVGCPDKQF
ncbi:hypothetical protein COU00_01805, partial [Candidatus Falkowbacteria bacterium CG10_big_fil_rev_8_21_14_0_10_43_11]